MADMDLEEHTDECASLLGSQHGAAPGRHQSNKHWRLTAGCVVTTDLFERVAFYGISGNMVIFCTNVLGYSSAGAVTVSMIFTGASYIMPLFGGWMADSIAGRFNTAYAGLLVYIIGALLLPAVALNYRDIFPKYKGGIVDLSQGFRHGYYLVGIFLVVIGSGCLRANNSPLGAAQVESQGKNTVNSFFNWYYWFGNIGATVAFSLVVYIQQEISFTWGYVATAVSVIITLIVFTVPRSKYIDNPPAGSILTRAIKMVYSGLRGRLCGSHSTKPCLDHAKVSSGGSFPDSEVEGVKAVGRIMPVLLTFILYWTISSQIYNIYLVQGERMDLRLGPLTLPAASLSLFNCVVIMVLVPVVDRGLYPLLDRLLCRPSQLQRIGVGMVLAILSVVCAAVVEIYRKRELSLHGGVPQDVAGVVYNASSLSVMWQVPQFTLNGAGEVFASISGLEFAYTEAPVSMQGLIMGMNLVTVGLGSLVGSAVLAIVTMATADDPWFPDEINFGHVEWYMFLIAGLGFLNLLVFLVVAKFYVYSHLGVTTTKSSVVTGGLYESMADSGSELNQSEQSQALCQQEDVKEKDGDVLL